MKKLKGISLFACSGIGELFLKNSNLDICLANEIDPKRVDLYNHFHKNTEVIVGDISKKSIYNELKNKALKNNIKFLLATPPCQGMSVAGKMDKKDKRNLLIKYAIQSIKDLNVDYALIENVPTMYKFPITHKSKTLTIKEYIEKELSKNYNLSFNVLDTKDYGIPQSRKRAITLIWKKNKKEWKLPEKKKIITVKKAIGHLPSLKPGETSDIKYHYAKEHNANHILWMSHTPTGKTALENKKYYPKINGRKIKAYSTTYKRISWDKPSPTITICNSAISSQNNVHPGNKMLNGLYSDPRVLTLKELFLLSGIKKIDLPKNYSNNFVRKMIGEAIPPKLILELVKQI